MNGEKTSFLARQGGVQGKEIIEKRQAKKGVTGAYRLLKKKPSQAESRHTQIDENPIERER